MHCELKASPANEKAVDLWFSTKYIAVEMPSTSLLSNSNFQT